jgi:hypothetical protein
MKRRNRAGIPANLKKADESTQSIVYYYGIAGGKALWLKLSSASIACKASKLLHESFLISRGSKGE